MVVPGVASRPPWSTTIALGNWLGIVADTRLLPPKVMLEVVGLTIPTVIWMMVVCASVGLCGPET